MKMNLISHEACCKRDTPALFLAACLFSLALVKQDKHVGSDFFLSAGFTLVAPSAITENEKKNTTLSTLAENSASLLFSVEINLISCYVI